MKKVLLFLLIILIILGGYLYFGYFSDINKTGLSGTVSRRGEYWGIESDVWYKNSKATVKNLPSEFQKEGAKVDCEATVVDVIGTSGWDKFAEVRNCKTR